MNESMAELLYQYQERVGLALSDGLSVSAAEQCGVFHLESLGVSTVVVVTIQEMERKANK